ncbi:hypothetical protein BGZ94_005856, partial [Podila epigama]
MTITKIFLRSASIITNYNIVKNISEDDSVEALVKAYLMNSRVQAKNVNQENFANAIQVFVTLTQHAVQPACSLPDGK